MSELRDFYETMGYDYEQIRNSPLYLTRLTLEAATELDNYLLNRNYDFSHVQEFAGILKEYQLKDSDSALTGPNFPYLPLWRIFRENSEKEIRQMSELALEMRLFRYELEDVQFNFKRLKKLRSLLCSLSREFSIEEQRYNPHLAFLAA